MTKILLFVFNMFSLCRWKYHTMIKKRISKFGEKLIKGLPEKCLNGLKKNLMPTVYTNINYDATDVNQKRVLISYMNIMNEDMRHILHSNIHHVNQMIHYFVQKNYCVDICDCNDLRSLKTVEKNNYIIIIGFGSVYKRMIHIHHDCKKILFVTENDPEVVSKKYKERLDYFRERHGNLKFHVEDRTGYYDQEQFVSSDVIIAMNSSYNTAFMKKYSKQLWNINSSGIINEMFTCRQEDMMDAIEESRYRFLWFGSRGVIHKGLDILLDLFRLYPEWTLDVYGLREEELLIFNKLKSNNVKNCGKIDVYSDAFVREVIMRHNVMLFPSCSEGMSTAVCTCLGNGIIPVVTKECGYEPHESIIELKSYHIEDIEGVIKSIINMSKEELFRRRLTAYNYGRDNFSLSNFDEQFNRIMNSILNLKNND